MTKLEALKKPSIGLSHKLAEGVEPHIITKMILIPMTSSEHSLEEEPSLKTKSTGGIKEQDNSNTTIINNIETNKSKGSTLWL